MLYNKQIATFKEKKPQGFWSKRLSGITEKRDYFPTECCANVPRNQMRDAVNKAAKIVVNHCLKYGTGTIVFGWNKGQKQSIELGSQTNQKFVQISTARLKERIQELCNLYGWQFVETEESYTSKASFLDDDFLPVRA
ncbi:MAG: IS200/IS605 family accessory protein TnpB-related protein [Trichodesmium sp.]